jgi:hypothetical protein
MQTAEPIAWATLTRWRLLLLVLQDTGHSSLNCCKVWIHVDGCSSIVYIRTAERVGMHHNYTCKVLKNNMIASCRRRVSVW